jgi:hypothetical protein
VARALWGDEVIDGAVPERASSGLNVWHVKTDACRASCSLYTEFCGWEVGYVDMRDEMLV